MDQLLNIVIVLLITLLKGSTSKGFFGYIGCYKEDTIEIQLTAERRSSLISMSIQQCNVFCFHKGYKFASTRKGNECYCGDLPERNLPTPQDEKLCDVPCLSDETTNCGGSSAYTLYSTGIQENGVNIDALKIGCLIDRGDSRLLSEHRIELTKTNTPKRCVAYCKALGYPKAGLEYGNECFCGMTERNWPIMQYGCDKRCPGNPDETCGGSWRIELFYTGAPQNANGTRFAGYMGCYRDGRDDITLSQNHRTRGKSMTVLQCNSYCFFKGYKFAANRNSDECICGDLGEESANPDEEGSCDSNCSGDVTTKCGGPNALTIHSTGIDAKDIEDMDILNVGCLEDSGNKRLIKEHKADFTDTNTRKLCISYCIALGYPYAGVQYGLECYCGMLPRSSPIVDGCDLPCSGNSSEKCGGHWRIDVYSTLVTESISDRGVVQVLNHEEDRETTTSKFYAGYTGCYSDDRSDVQITSEQRVTERTMTVQQCIIYCFQKGYKFSATKKGNECSCGDLLEDNVPTPDSDKLCNTTCLSDESTMCGGGNAYTVYSTGITEKEIGDINALKIGCLEDNGETRLIEEHKADLTKTNTPQRCIAYCKNLGYPHAGLQYGIECFCGISQRTSPIVEGCDVPCAGNADVNCGGHWRLDVYKTGTSNVTMDITLNGCFVYDEDAAITRKTIEDMTPNKCIANCFRQGLSYAHIYNGVECMCGRTLSSRQLRVSTAKCDKPCRGDQNQICGGETHMLTYTTGVNGNPILGRQESCYKDENNDLLSGPKYNLGMENSIEFCVSRCIEAGYAFAGLRNTQECQCTDSTPKRSLGKMVSSDFCKAPCPRIELQSCGAATYVVVYRTGVVPYNENVTESAIPGYLGCFKDNRNEIRLTGDQATVRALTASACYIKCFKQGFKHAATRNGKECYCGDLNGAIPKPDDDKLCNVQCTSDITTHCGGRNAFSLYSTGIDDNDIDNLDELEIGCLRDSDDIRLIPEHKVDLTLTNSPKRCLAYCKALGYPHAGVQYSIECYCGMIRENYQLDDGCDKTCSGDPDYFCGGDWKANVYSTGLTKLPPRISPRGCFNYNRTLITTKRIISDMSPNKCVAHCYSQGFTFAFIHNSLDCLCGSKLPTSKFRADSSKCDIMCPSDSNSRCGSIEFMSAFSTSVVVHPSLGRLVGCYKDDNNDLMTGKKLNLGQLNGIVLCVSRCIQEGFAFAGIRNTNECQCSQTAPKRTPVKIVPDYECASPCPMNNLEFCGAPLFTAIYRTGLFPSKQNEQCPTSSSKFNGKSACGGQTLFTEDFKTLDPQKWEHVVKISGEDGEFVTYTKKKKNVFIENEKLIIQPTLVKDSFVKYGTLDLKGCTGEPNSADCNAVGKSFHILPPVESGQICTKHTFNFRYGVVTIRAKLPKGDWVVPEIWLKPVREVYGKGYVSGKIMIVSSRGNPDLDGAEGHHFGGNLVESGFQVSTEPYWNIVGKTETLLGPEPWYNDFHNYTFTWTPDTLLFYVDGNVLSGLKTLYRISERSLLDELGLKKELRWNNGSIIAPFDEDFYMCIGVSVGGMRSFPDGSISNGYLKPWSNKDIKSRLKFFLNKHLWEPTWSNETRLEVDSIKITAY